MSEPRVETKTTGGYIVPVDFAEKALGLAVDENPLRRYAVFREPVLPPTLRVRVRRRWRDLCGRLDLAWDALRGRHDCEDDDW